MTGPRKKAGLKNNNNPMQREPKVIITAIICIAILEIIALLKGIDGTYFSLVLAVIGGLAGYGIKSIKKPTD